MSLRIADCWLLKPGIFFLLDFFFFLIEWNFLDVFSVFFKPVSVTIKWDLWDGGKNISHTVHHACAAYGLASWTPSEQIKVIALIVKREILCHDSRGIWTTLHWTSTCVLTCYYRQYTQYWLIIISHLCTHIYRWLSPYAAMKGSVRPTYPSNVSLPRTATNSAVSASSPLIMTNSVKLAGPDTGFYGWVCQVTCPNHNVA